MHNHTLKLSNNLLYEDVTFIHHVLDREAHWGLLLTQLVKKLYSFSFTYSKELKVAFLHIFILYSSYVLMLACCITNNTILGARVCCTDRAGMFCIWQYLRNAEAEKKTNSCVVNHIFLRETGSTIFKFRGILEGFVN